MRSAIGSIRQLDDAPPKKEGRYELRYAGHSKTVRGTRGAAERALPLFVAMHSGKAPTVKVELGQAITTRIEHIEADRSPKTIDDYRRQTATHITPYPITHVTIDKLTTGDLERHYKMLTGKGVTAPTLRIVHAVIGSSLQQAWKWGWVPENVARRVELPSSKAERRQIPDLSVLQAVFADLDEHHPALASMVRVSAATGLRRGELCGLRWDCVDLDEGWLVIARTVVYVAPNRIIRETAKTAGSLRRIEIGPDTIAVLTERWGQAQEWAETCGVTLEPATAFVWSDDPDSRTPWLPATATNRWRRAATRQGLEGLHLHDLRHLHASYLLALGIPIGDVSARLGHASPAITSAIYQHGIGQGREAADMMEKALRGD